MTILSRAVRPLILALLGAGSLTHAASASSHDAILEEIIVIGSRPSLVQSELEDTIDPAKNMMVHAAGLARFIPGGALLNNGALSGQVQFRGLTGDRIGISVDGQHFGSGGPNLMDPPLHYAPMTLLAALEFSRGPGSVSKGPGLGGQMNARLKSVSFSRGDDFALVGDMSLLGSSSVDTYGIGGVFGAANEKLRVQFIGSKEMGNDGRFSGGTIPNSFFDRSVWGLGGGWQSQDKVHEVEIDMRRHETSPSGNAPFAMDIEFVDGDFLNGSYKGDFDGWDLEVTIGGSEIFHGMNNFENRPAPPAMRQRRTLAEAESYSFAAQSHVSLGVAELRMGFDYQEDHHDALITNPDDADFFLTSVAGSAENRHGVFVEIYQNHSWGGFELGVRYDLHDGTSGGPKVGSSVPAMPSMLAMSAAMMKRDWSDDTIDGVLQVWYDLSDSATLRGSFARKTRMPSYLERVAWLPTPASGGLADGNTYVGRMDLAPEEALIAEIGVDYVTEALRIRPTFYARRIDGFIQGTPFDGTPGVLDTATEMVSNMNGDPTPLRFTNVDAEIFGFDMDLSWLLSDGMQVDGAFSWVEGKRRDIDDNLYRMSPLTARLGVTFLSENWRATGELAWTLKQDQVSATNSEASTKGMVWRISTEQLISTMPSLWMLA